MIAVIVGGLVLVAAVAVVILSEMQGPQDTPRPPWGQI